ncbi:hypothetical protein [Acidimangrovimonas pyrenivorans]|uniref:Uncharacterized protein n=1 Tax=Acidimangrovimonas pyrenivorans TaxID=2030798 RepID=A0ABV7AEZ7_9RHOB
MRLAAALLTCLMLTTLAARAETVLTLGIYLWTGSDSEPVRAQYMSIASGVAEAETDGPEGYNSTSRPVTDKELSLMKAAIRGRMTALTLEPKKPVDPPFVTVEWHFSDEMGYAEGIGTYPLDQVPAAVQAFQQEAFGKSYGNASLPPAKPQTPETPPAPEAPPEAPASAD